MWLPFDTPTILERSRPIDTSRLVALRDRTARTYLVVALLLYVAAALGWLAEAPVSPHEQGGAVIHPETEIVPWYNAGRIGGLSVVRVLPESRVAALGLEEGDLIISVGGQPIIDAATAVDAALSISRGHSSAQLAVLRDGMVSVVEQRK